MPPRLHPAALAAAPLLTAWPDRVRQAGAAFRSAFGGAVAYAVKANPASWALSALMAAGVRRYDIASIDEAATVRAIDPTAELAFMHPVKSRPAIASAHADFGCRITCCDHPDELAKIREETGGASDVVVMVRLTVPNTAALLPLTGKFGAEQDAAIALLRETDRCGLAAGLTFHVGSQCLNPNAFRDALRVANRVAGKAGVPIAQLNVGGGFPAPYPGVKPPPLEHYAAAILDEKARSPHLAAAELWVEPGRALVASAATLEVTVELRRDDALYINDGAFGALYDAAQLGWRYPVRLLRPSTAPTQAFRLFGPTCDCDDVINGPFELPADIGEGDRLEISMMGAYGAAMATRFNGFGVYREQIRTAQTQPGPYHAAAE